MHAPVHTLGFLEYPFCCALHLGRTSTGLEGLCCNKIHRIFFIPAIPSCAAFTARAPRHKFALSSI